MSEEKVLKLQAQLIDEIKYSKGLEKRISALETKDYDRIEKILERYDLQNNAIWHIINELLGICDIPEGFEPDFSDFIRETLNKNRLTKVEEKLKEVEGLLDDMNNRIGKNSEGCRKDLAKLKELEKRQQAQSFPFQKMKELEQLLPKKIEIIKESLEKQCDKWFDKRDKDHIKDHLELEQKIDFSLMEEKEPSKSPAEDKDYGIIECSDKICEEMLNDCRKELIAEFRNDIITKLDYFSSKIWEVHLNPNFEKEIIEALKGLDKDWKLKQEARKNQ